MLVIWFVFALFPMLWLVLLALKTQADQTTTYFTFSPTLENFETVSPRHRLTSVDFKAALVNSVIMCVGAVLVSLVIGIPSAYAAGRFKYRGSKDLMFTILSFRFAPELMVIVPLFVIYNQVGLFDTKAGMIWVLQLVTMPLVVWILRSDFQDLPEDLEQAALLDGYTRRRAFVMVALPLVRPGIAAAALLAFIFAWNNYVFPLILADTNACTVTWRSPSSSAAAAGLLQPDRGGRPDRRAAAAGAGADHPALPGARPELRSGEVLMATLQVRGLQDEHGKTTALDDLDFEVGTASSSSSSARPAPARRPR